MGGGSFDGTAVVILHRRGRRKQRDAKHESGIPSDVLRVKRFGVHTSSRSRTALQGGVDQNKASAPGHSPQAHHMAGGGCSRGFSVCSISNIEMCSRAFSAASASEKESVYLEILDTTMFGCCGVFHSIRRTRVFGDAIWSRERKRKLIDTQFYVFHEIRSN